MKKRKTQLRARTEKDILLDQIIPNSGIFYWYKEKLSKAIKEMSAEYTKAIKEAYRGENIIAGDSMAGDLEAILKSLNVQWTMNFNVLSEEVAKSFANQSMRHTDAAFLRTLKKHNFTVKLNLSNPVKSASKVIINENVSLIKSIHSQYHTQINTMVWESVKSGGDLATLTESFMKRFDVTLSRATFIASDQNAKAHSVFEKLRREEVGIEYAIWIHAHGAKQPRVSHQAKHNHKYKLSEGMYIDGEWIHPKQKPNCNCGSKAIIPGVNSE